MRRFLRYSIGLVLFVCIGYLLFAFWKTKDPDTFLFLGTNYEAFDSASDVAAAFALALRLNHKIAYELTDPSLHLKLDEWMANHKPRDCDEWALGDGNFLSFGNPSRLYEYDVAFTCYLHKGGLYSFNVENIVVQSLKVVSWGTVEED